MAKEVLMPKLSSTMTHGSITEWFKEEGDYVKVGEPIFEVMTDKIAIEVESYEEGYLLKRYAEVNEEVPVSSIVAYIGEEGEEVPEAVEFKEEGESESLETVAEVEEKKETEVVEEGISSKVRATPAARKSAKENQVNLAKVKGSGRKGRVHLEDVEKFVKRQAVETSTATETSLESSVEKVVPWSGMRKAIADQMTASANEIPHVSMVATADVTDLLKFRSKLLANINEDQSITLTDLFTYFVSRVLKNHKGLNANTGADGITIFNHVNLGLAVAVDNGLIVPVVKRADQLSLLELSNKNREVTELARNNRLTPDLMQGGTFTVSAIGRSSVKNFTSIINHPEVGILGIGTLYKELELKEGNLVEKDKIDLTLSFDHRAIDGYPASLFLNELVNLVENPDLVVLK